MRSCSSPPTFTWVMRTVEVRSPFACTNVPAYVVERDDCAARCSQASGSLPGLACVEQATPRAIAGSQRAVPAKAAGVIALLPGWPPGDRDRAKESGDGRR